jgi:hypothetical protein
MGGLALSVGLSQLQFERVLDPGWSLPPEAAEVIARILPMKPDGSVESKEAFATYDPSWTERILMRR